MNCRYCERECVRPSSLAVHERTCKQNPDRQSFPRSPKAGRQKGCQSHNKGQRQSPEEILARTIELVESGKILQYCESEIRRHVKAYLIHSKGHVCQMCGTREWQGQPVPLVCDHIDGNSDNNELHNFRNVCCNCDAQLPTFKSKNRGKGRSYDRDYKRLNGGLARAVEGA